MDLNRDNICSVQYPGFPDPYLTISTLGDGSGSGCIGDCFYNNDEGIPVRIGPADIRKFPDLCTDKNICGQPTNLKSTTTTVKTNSKTNPWDSWYQGGQGFKSTNQWSEYGGYFCSNNDENTTPELKACRQLFGCDATTGTGDMKNACYVPYKDATIINGYIPENYMLREIRPRFSHGEKYFMSYQQTIENAKKNAQNDFLQSQYQMAISTAKMNVDKINKNLKINKDLLKKKELNILKTKEDFEKYYEISLNAKKKSDEAIKKASDKNATTKDRTEAEAAITYEKNMTAQANTIKLNLNSTISDFNKFKGRIANEEEQLKSQMAVLALLLDSTKNSSSNSGPNSITINIPSYLQ